ncbi:hypothetical protein Tbd_0086 [Thiobacillus denitrificans ATCC 25259]|uniref:Transmembrane protein n=1 Tax=Thiobacillus denitrificans (strain ATCC 25259 / T1) TaxID=292415 RepID=Q3SMK6_THIDA|nr:hypothetical protein [Thiobacillus denitrificans]AAZ96039.1 hypothetical protein Tbd_0086 [Thiobacillus denitrificans ATCC 25259]
MEVGFVWLARLMFVGIFFLGIGMLYRAWSIGVRRDLRYVADWRGRPVRDGARWAGVVMAINSAGGIGLLAVGVAVVTLGLQFALWTGLTAFIIWTYYFALRVVVHRAHVDARV